MTFRFYHIDFFLQVESVLAHSALEALGVGREYANRQSQRRSCQYDIVFIHCYCRIIQLQ